MYQVYNDEYLMHHGIKGMHWGIRRYQNVDGSFKSEKKKQKYIRDSEKITRREKTKARRYFIGGMAVTGLSFCVANRTLFRLPVKEAVKETAKKSYEFVKNNIGGAL